MPAQIIPFPQELRPQLPTIVGNVDYLTLRQRLEQIDALLRDSGVERQFVQRALEGWPAAAARTVTALEQLKFQQRLRRALRCPILRTLLQEDYRGFSCQLAGNPLSATRSINGSVRSMRWTRSECPPRARCSA